MQFFIWTHMASHFSMICEVSFLKVSTFSHSWELEKSMYLGSDLDIFHPETQWILGNWGRFFLASLQALAAAAPYLLAAWQRFFPLEIGIIFEKPSLKKQKWPHSGVRWVPVSFKKDVDGRVRIIPSLWFIVPASNNPDGMWWICSCIGP